jgi:hypothetical protein
MDVFLFDTDENHKEQDWCGTQFDTFTSKQETVLGHHHTTHHALESTPFDHPPT